MRVTSDIATASERPAARAAPPVSGPIMAIGGAEDKLDNKVILSTFLQISGGSNARLAILPTASSIESAGERYKALFLSMGAESAEVAYFGERPSANAGPLLNVLEGSTGIFLTGGNQLRLSALLGGTEVSSIIRRRHNEGAVIAGTSAGASILSSHMVGYGASGNTPKQRMAQMVAGFGLVHDVIIDQHFRQRDRIGRLLALVASNPRLLGVGIDEDTAVLFDHHQTMEVIGRRSVTVVDGRHMESNIYQVKRYGEISITGATLHMLTAGRRFDLADRAVLD
ncbi:MAG: cyanophycinase [Thermomicrobiales bacterium]